MGNKWWWATFVVVVLVAVGVTSWFVNAPAGPRSAPVPELVTVTVGAAGDSQTIVTYSCIGPNGSVASCDGGRMPASMVWSKRISVPAGTLVFVSASGSGPLPYRCWVSDQLDRVPFSEDRGSHPVCQHRT